MSTDHLPHLTCAWADAHNWDHLNLHDVPDEPGFYAFTSYPGKLQPSMPDRQVLYVGIATKSIRERIRKYKNGDATGLMNMHRGGFMLMLSRGAAHAQSGGLTHSVQRNPVQVIVKPTATSAGHQYTLAPESIYLRWAVDYRAAIEALLIQQLAPKFNTMHAQG